MNHLKLNPDIREHVKAEIGSDVPDPNSPDFEPFLAHLKETRPQLAEALVQGLEVQGAELPEETQARLAGRREGRRNLVRRFFFSRSYEGEPNLNKRKTLAVIVGALVATLPIALIIDGFAARRDADSAPAVVASEISETVAEPVAPLLPTQEAVERDSNFEPTDLPKAPTLPATARNDLPPPPGPVDPRVANSPPGSSSSPTLSVTGQHSDATEQVQPQTLSVLAAQPAPPAALTVSALASAPEQLALAAGATQATSPAAPGFQSLSVVGQQNDVLEEPKEPGLTLDNSSPGTLPDDAPLTTPHNLTLQQSAAELSEPDPNGRYPFQPAPTQAHDSQGATGGAELSYTLPSLQEEASLTPLSSQSNSKAPSTIQPSATPPKSSSTPITFQPGTQIPARLVTGIAVTEGVSSPVVAETSAGEAWCGEEACPAVTWLGTAQLLNTGRVALQLEQTVIDGETRAVTATALGEDRVPGLKASLSDASPTVAQDLLRAAAGGVSDYVEALADRQTVTVEEGAVTFRDADVPSLDRFLLGRAAKLFDLPSAQTTVVRIAQIAPGTPLVVLYGVGDGG